MNKIPCPNGYRQMELLPRVSDFIVRHRMVEQGVKVLAAVSGGPDSVAMLHILNLLKDDLGISLHVAHLNHRFRGAESDEDARFVTGLAGRYQLPCTVEALDVTAYQKRKNLSKQVAAREVRYRFLLDTAALAGARRIALAHQADDQAETILINFLRGAGVPGLKGIVPVRENLYIRPLLTVRRFEIERYCREQDLPFRQDSSNLEQIYLRNRIRQDLVPVLEKGYNPALVPALLRLGEICREEDAFLEDASVKAYQESLLEESTEKVVLGLERLGRHPAALRRRILRLAWQSLARSSRNLAYSHTETLMDLVGESPAGSRAVLPGNIAARRTYETLEIILGQGRPKIPYYIYPLNIPGATFIPEIGRTVHAVIKPRVAAGDPRLLPREEALLDLDRLPSRIFVRRRREGDIFHPFGHVAGGKLKDFLIKQKIPQEERDKIPLVSTPGEIIWAGGVRTGEGFKIKDTTGQVLHLKLDP
ncbi:MAG: tRNA(Ile)-lysidine synthase [Firmicutes bacterium ADurb.Bin456]|nr:MAG: tRNA(Ile)-lysidine synthase [Firmicutes bacterium ADurb.Bin456]